MVIPAGLIDFEYLQALWPARFIPLLVVFDQAFWFGNQIGGMADIRIETRGDAINDADAHLTAFLVKGKTY